MKTNIKIFVLILGLFYGIDAFSQTEKFFKNDEGIILNEKEYRDLKIKKLASVSSVKLMKKFDIYEEITELYQRNDSLVVLYKWHITDDVKGVEKAIERDKRIIGMEYPIQGIQTLDGKLMDIEDLKGKPTLVNLWFTACAPCIKEMPALNEMKRKHEDRFNFLAVTFDPESKVRKSLNKHPFDFVHIVDSKDLTTKLGFEGYPVNLILDKNGIVRHIEGGIPFDFNSEGKFEVTDGKEFVQLLEGLL